MFFSGCGSLILGPKYTRKEFVGDSGGIMLNTTSSSEPKPFFQANQRQPYHLSVGSVLFNNKKLIACHHFKEILGQRDLYYLMRESIEDNEDVISTLDRGLMEEFGAKGKHIAFLGSLSGELPDDKLPFNKTTLYVVSKMVSWDNNLRDKNDPESKSIIEWHKPQELIKIMKNQGQKYNRIDLDESKIIERALPYIFVE